ncbi:Glycosyltransferase involved in cell wall bisynthesis [Streptomyces sp. WMMB 714]|nr:glycosyltransferase [Streptomyces sp. WMMB 714]SCK55984.1 Glycosyltransferase involved in cell wall bisynthesis [Streptomyces sp. WMMB 714]
MLSQREVRKDRLTVLHLAQPVDGGVARVVSDLAGAQVRNGVRVVVGCPAGGRLAGHAFAAGADVEHWAAVRELGPQVAAETVRAHRLIRRVRPHIVHAHSAKAGLAARLALRGRVPTVYQPHAWSFEAVHGATALLARAWERSAARWTDRLLCVSEAERRTGERAGVDGRWAVVPNGVDLGRFTTFPGDEGDGTSPGDGGDDETARAACRAALPLLRALPEDAPLVVCVGRLCPQKGQKSLLKAWADVTAQVPGAWLVLVGDGPDRAALEARAPRQVLFAGASDAVGRWYAAADVTVLPSRWEGMALTPLEAMACGRPVVVTDVGGARECLPPGQEDLCLVPPDDPEALAASVTRILRDDALRAHLGEAARKHVTAEFDVRRTASSVLDLYREVLGAREVLGPHAPADTRRPTR